MKKIIIYVFTLLALVACGNKSENNKEISTYDIPLNNNGNVINNLANQRSITDLKSIMTEAGLAQKNIDRFFEQVEFFNTNIPTSLLISEDYLKKDAIIDYQVYDMQDALFDKFSDFAGINCRITTFGLLSDKIKVADTSNPNLEITMIDNTSFDNAYVPTLSDEETNSFNKFYSPIPVTNENDPKKHIKAIEDFYKANGISFESSDKFSNISVFVPSNIEKDKNELFVGHTGVLFELNDGRIMLVEKLAFTSPYQVVVFNDRKQLAEYLNTIYDTSSKDYPIKPVIVENDKLLKSS